MHRLGWKSVLIVGSLSILLPSSFSVAIEEFPPGVLNRAVEALEGRKVGGPAEPAQNFKMGSPSALQVVSCKPEGRPKSGPLLDRRGQNIRPPQWDSFTPPFTPSCDLTKA